MTEINPPGVKEIVVLVTRCALDMLADPAGLVSLYIYSRAIEALVHTDAIGQIPAERWAWLNDVVANLRGP